MINLGKIVKEEKMENTSKYLRDTIKTYMHPQQATNRCSKRESKENVDGKIQRDNDKIYQN